MKKKWLVPIVLAIVASFLFGSVYGQTVADVVLHVVGNVHQEGKLSCSKSNCA